MKRRKFLTLSTLASVSLLSGCGDTNSSDEEVVVKDDTKYLAGNLPIPPLLEGEERNGVRHYDLTIVESEHQFFSDVKTKSYGIDSSYLGPTLRVEEGAEVSINYTNHLKEATTMHGHGMHVNGDMDGTAHQVIGVGETWSARYKLKQQACTNWYHPHYMHKTAEHVYQGLAGLIIIEDAQSRSFDLPHRYGIDDIPLVLQDRFFSDDKRELLYDPSMSQLTRGYIGDHFIVNGAIEPLFDAEAKEIRFRLLNGSNSTMYDLGFSDGVDFKQIASDNGFLEVPLQMSRIVLSPGERAEIVVDFTAQEGRELILQEYNYNQTFMKIKVQQGATSVTTLPDRLITYEPVGTPVVSRSFALGMVGMGAFAINGKQMDMARIDLQVIQGDVEEWEIINMMSMDHNFHVHGTYLRVVSRNNDTSAVDENEKGYKDVVYVPANERVKVIVKVGDVTADSSNPFMFHCHFLEHEDNGMMGQFTVSS